MLSSVDLWQTKHWKRTLPPQDEQGMFYGSYPPTGSWEHEPSPDYMNWDTYSIQAASTFRATSSLQDTQDYLPFDHALTTFPYGSARGTLAPEDFKTPNHFARPSLGSNFRNSSSEPRSALDVGSSHRIDASLYGPTAFNSVSPGCQTSPLEDRIPMDFDRDLDSFPGRVSQTMFNMYAESAPGLANTGLNPLKRTFGVDDHCQGYDLSKPHPEEYWNTGRTTMGSGETIHDTQPEAFVDGHFMPQDIQDMTLPPGPFDQRDISPLTDAESLICEVPGCGKTFDKRHRFK